VLSLRRRLVPRSEQAAERSTAVGLTPLDERAAYQLQAEQYQQPKKHRRNCVGLIRDRIRLPSHIPAIAGATARAERPR
jgi:hypothetical protein